MSTILEGGHGKGVRLGEDSEEDQGVVTTQNKIALGYAKSRVNLRVCTGWTPSTQATNAIALFLGVIRRCLSGASLGLAEA